MSGLTIEFQENGRCVLSGKLDEDSKLSSLLEQPASSLILNLKDIVMINSVGTNHWIECLETLRAQGIHIEYEECSTAVMHQCGMVSDFAKGIPIRSCYVMCYCEVCDEDSTLLLQNPREQTDPVFLCPACGAEMEPDDAPDFLNT